jgi:DNA polymerase elongation subunit (family B)
VTSSGQLTIRWTEKKLNQYINVLLKTSGIDYVVASDTDSIYLELDSIVELIGRDKDKYEITAALDRFVSEKIAPKLEKIYAELQHRMGAYQQKMHMKRETIAGRSIWKAKKMYILSALDIEGVKCDPPEIKMSGIEAVRSSTPHVCRDNIKKAIGIILHGSQEELYAFIDKFRDEFNALKFEDIAFPRSVNGMDKYSDNKRIYGDKTPIAVRGALLFNHLCREHGLKTIQPISDGDKVKFAYLRLPNPIGENVISIAERMPVEFGLEDFIDRNLQFDKAFLEPLKSIVDVIGWTLEKKSSLERFF